jgi:hypothetical protein
VAAAGGRIGSFRGERFVHLCRGEPGDATSDRRGGQDHDPQAIPSPDRVRRGEVYEKVWAALVLSTIDLVAGPTRLVARALEIPGGQAGDVKAVRLRRVM